MPNNLRSQQDGKRKQSEAVIAAKDRQGQSPVEKELSSLPRQ